MTSGVSDQPNILPINEPIALPTPRSVLRRRHAQASQTSAPNSVAWQNAVREFARLTKESLDLARMLGDPNILEIAETVGACVRGECPVEAVAAGL